VEIKKIQTNVDLSASASLKQTKQAESLMPQDKVEIGQTTSPPRKEWTVMLYSAADNNLESYLVQDAIDLESVGSDENVNVLLQLDRGKSPSSISGSWAGCRRFYLVKDSDSQNLNSPVLENMGRVDMSNPKTLKDFLVWGIKNYPAKNYLLIASDHGGGYEGTLQDMDGGGGKLMTVPGFAKAIADAEKETGEKINIVGFDACLMAETEVAYEMKDGAKYLVASEQTEGGDGWPYIDIFSKEILKTLQETIRLKGTVTPEELAKKIVEKSSHHTQDIETLSATDLEKMDKLASSIDKFAKAIVASPVAGATFKSIAGSTESFSGFKDLGDFCDRIIKSKEVNDKDVKESAKEVLKTLSEVIIAEQHISSYDAHGLTINLPSWGGEDAKYKELKFTKDTSWQKALDKIAGKDTSNDQWEISR